MPAIIASNRDYTDKASSGNDSAVLVVGTQEPNSVFLNCQFLAPVGCEWGAKMPGNTGSRFTDCLFDCEDGERTLDIVQGSDLGFTRCHFTYPDPIKTRFSLRKHVLDWDQRRIPRCVFRRVRDERYFARRLFDLRSRLRVPACFWD